MLDILQLFITSIKPLYFLIFFLLGSQCCRAYSNKPRRLVSWLTLLYLCYSCWYIGYIQFWINTGKLLQCFDQNILFHWGVDHFLQILVIYKFIFVYLYLEFMLLNGVNCFSPDCGFVGDLVDAVVPFMGESITDGTLAKFLKSMLF